MYSITEKHYGLSTKGKLVDAYFLLSCVADFMFFVYSCPLYYLPHSSWLYLCLKQSVQTYTAMFFSLYLNLHICIYSKYVPLFYLHHFFIFISERSGCFQFGLFKTSCHYQIPLSKSQRACTLVNTFHLFCSGFQPLSQPHIKGYGPGNERRTRLWLAKAKDF